MSAPIVTGVSPKEGPPGTKITIRGENFGRNQSDLLSLTICDFDCSLSAEWKSSNKIIARSGPGKGLGDIIITTKLGGVGTCTVKFRGYHETVGPLKESAVWVDDHISSNSSRRSLSPTVYQNEDPLCLFVEATDKAIPEDDLNELFPNRSGIIGSDDFSPGWFLLQYHLTTRYEDLKAGLSHLRRKVNSQKEGQLSFLKANVGSVLDQLDTLTELKDKLEGGVKDVSKSTAVLERKIFDTEKEVVELFQEVLARREQAEAKRNALSVLQRFRFLFCLPSTIDRYVSNNEFDLIVNDYAKVKRLFGNTEVPLFRKVLEEIDKRIDNARSRMLKILEEVPLSFEEFLKLIRNLCNLEPPNDPAWLAINYFVNHLCQNMYELKDKYIVMETSENAKKNRPGYKISEGKPHRVIFVEDLLDLMEMKFPDLWKLGQSYFGGEFPIQVAPENAVKFKEMTLNVIQTFSNLMRAAILPQTLQKSQMRNSFGTWSSSSFDTTLPWLPHCLRYIRACYSCFIRLDLPSDALDILSEVIFDLRVFISLSQWKQASEEVEQLKDKENWMIDVHEEYGGITELPLLFNEITLKVIRTVHETVLISEVREIDLLSNPNATAKFVTAIQVHFQKFVDVLEGSTENIERASVLSQLNATAENQDQKNEQRLLVVMCNADYTLGVVVPTVLDKLSGHMHPKTPSLVSNISEMLSALSNRISEQYFEHKCDPLVGTIEPSMYFAHFDWDDECEPTDIRPYSKEIILNLIGVRSELYRIPARTLKRILYRFVETVAEELARLMSCVKGFSEGGRIQATADIIAVREATKGYASAKALAFFKEALDNIPDVDHKGSALARNICEGFSSSMALQLLSLKVM